MDHRFYRLCVDVDRVGNVRGASYEVHAGDDVLSFGTVLVGPFDTDEEALAATKQAVIERFGLELALRF